MRTRGTVRPHRPPHLATAWPEVSAAIRGAERLAVFADFDGTLTPIQRRPSHVRLSQRVRRLLDALVDRNHIVGIISGRAVDDLAKRVALSRLWYVGNQGFELRAPTTASVVLARPAELKAILRTECHLRERLRNVPGIAIEAKGPTLSVHVRGATRASRLAAREAVRATIREDGGLRLQRGKQVMEILPDSACDKARAVSFILRWARHAEPGVRLLAVYVGDDHADERVFAKWQGLSIAVGPPRITAARYFVRSPAEVGAFLRSLVQLAA